ncbi:MAG TPA: hypothetical protein VG406_20120 [Isosphaeraceae bacterium]|jgi:hypothetical protein|nr:hypothetical protein [Isosphaeraceae bacterium]
MVDLQRFKDNLRRSFEISLVDPVVNAGPGDFSMVWVSVVSPTFEGMDEGDRQEIVWQRVLDDFEPADQKRIEFIYTDAPSEVAP